MKKPKCKPTFDPSMPGFLQVSVKEAGLSVTGSESVLEFIWHKTETKKSTQTETHENMNQRFPENVYISTQYVWECKSLDFPACLFIVLPGCYYFSTTADEQQQDSVGPFNVGLNNMSK